MLIWAIWIKALVCNGLSLGWGRGAGGGCSTFLVHNSRKLFVRLLGIGPYSEVKNNTVMSLLCESSLRWTACLSFILNADASVEQPVMAQRRKILKGVAGSVQDNALIFNKHTPKINLITEISSSCTKMSEKNGLMGNLAEVPCAVFFTQRQFWQCKRALQLFLNLQL